MGSLNPSRESDILTQLCADHAQIKLKVHKSKDDKVREKTREHMLEMLNARF